MWKNDSPMIRKDCRSILDLEIEINLWMEFLNKELIFHSI
jgi:hypothetical protein